MLRLVLVSLACVVGVCLGHPGDGGGGAVGDMSMGPSCADDQDCPEYAVVDKNPFFEERVYESAGMWMNVFRKELVAGADVRRVVKDLLKDVKRYFKDESLRDMNFAPNQVQIMQSQEEDQYVIIASRYVGHRPEDLPEPASNGKNVGFLRDYPEVSVFARDFPSAISGYPDRIKLSPRDAEEDGDLLGLAWREAQDLIGDLVIYSREFRPRPIYQIFDDRVEVLFIKR